MSDDKWREDVDDEFGPPLFGDDAGGTLSFGDDSVEPMPHWTAPPTGEVPSTLGTSADSTDDLDVWSSFSSDAPAWGDGTARDDAEPFGGTGRGLFDDDADLVAPRRVEAAPAEYDDFDEFSAEVPRTYDEVTVPAPGPRPRGRIQIGTDPTDGGVTRPASRRPRPGETPPRGRPSRANAPGRVPPRGGRPGQRPPAQRPGGGRPRPASAGRDLPTAVAVGVLIAAVFVAALRFRPWSVAAIVVLVLGLGAVEFFDRVRDRGYEPAIVPGIVACVAAPLAVYHYGVGSLVLVVFLAFAATAVSFVSAPSLESNPMPNMAITALGVVWIGALGSFATAMLEYGRGLGLSKIGTDTLCLVAIGVVANDVGALFVGSAVGRTPLREWISPNKTVEGLVGGTVLTLGAMFLVSISEISTTWNGLGDLLLLGIVVAITAPLGDLTESMFKRNLDVKDFGSIVKGHGGVLDRFDGFLFTLPAAYYLLITVQPWIS